MQVFVAQKAGACYGVQRALDLALKASETQDEVHTLGELIHNPRVVEELKRQGVEIAHTVDEIESGTVVIRSHGVAPAVFDQIQKRGLKIIDATCPHVQRAQKAAAELAEDHEWVIIVGEEGHPEVEGIKAHALRMEGRVVVVSSPDELPQGLNGTVGVVVQTTQKLENLQNVVCALEGQGIKPHVKNTICSATQKRQEEANELACLADAMIVIGGRNSSNTTRLAEICRDQCERTYHVETTSEVTLDMLKSAEVVGVTAGASTPKEQIDEAIAHIVDLGYRFSGAVDVKTL